MKTNGREEGDGCKEAIKRRKAEAEHPEAMMGNGRGPMELSKAGEESEESRLRKTVRYLKELSNMENKESGKTQKVVEVAEGDVNEEEEEWMTEEEPRQGYEGGDLDPEQVRQSREEEMNYMVKTLKMFEFGSWEDATSRTSKMPTTTTWVGPRRTTLENIRQMQIGGARLQTKACRTKRRLVRGDAIAGSEESFVRVRCGCA